MELIHQLGMTGGYLQWGEVVWVRDLVYLTQD
jgi:hypothetical protein